MSGWKFTFPLSRTCLWDRTQLGKANELTLAKSGLVYVQLSLSTLQLALNHARLVKSKKLDCFLIGTSWVDKDEIIVMEMNRFDPGHSSKDRKILSPTSLMTDDIPVRTQILFGSHPDAKYLTHNLSNLQETLSKLSKTLDHHPASTLDLSSFLSLRIHCSCSNDNVVTVQCGCVLPSLAYQVSPIRSIPIVQTALARNLCGPLPISVVQGKIKHGFVTMNSSRMLVLLVHSDPKVTSLPLVGVWVSGVDSIHHPMVWATCVTYAHSTALADKVWGEEDKRTFVVLIYFKGSSCPHFVECQSLMTQGRMPLFTMTTAAIVLQSWSEHKFVGVELRPVKESTALHTLLVAALASVSSSSSSSSRSNPENAPPKLAAPSCHFQNVSFDSPLPLPQPISSKVPQRIARDINLSLVSHLSTEEHSYCHQENSPTNMSSGDSSNHLKEETGGDLIVFPQKQQLVEHPVHSSKVTLASSRPSSTSTISTTATRYATTIATAEVSTNTGESLHWPHPPFRGAEIPSYVDSPSDEEMIDFRVTDLSMRTANSIFSQETSNMHLDLHSYANSPSVTSQSFGESASINGGPADYEEVKQDANDDVSPFSRLLIQNESEFYEVMLAQIQTVIKQQNEEEEEEEEGFSSIRQQGSSSPPSFTPSCGLSSSIRDLGMSGKAAHEKRDAVECNGHTGSDGLCSDISGEPGHSTCSLPLMRMEPFRTTCLNSSNHCVSKVLGQHGKRTISSEDAYQKCNVDDESDVFPVPPYNTKKCYSDGHDSLQAPVVDEVLLQSTGHTPYRDSSQFADENRRLNLAICPTHNPMGVSLDVGSNYSLNLQSLLRTPHTEDTKCTDMLYQQCLSDISLLSLPPSGVNTMLLTAGLWGLNYSMDENVHQADLIGMKYLQGTSSAASGCVGDGGGDVDNHCGRPGNFGGALPTGDLRPHDSNQTLALSTTTYQFLERHEIIPKRMDIAAAPPRSSTWGHNRKCGVVAGSPLTNDVQDVPSSSTSSNILDIRRLKTLPKLF